MRVTPPVGMRIPRLDVPSRARLHTDDHPLDFLLLRVMQHYGEHQNHRSACERCDVEAYGAD